MNTPISFLQINIKNLMKKYGYDTLIELSEASNVKYDTLKDIFRKNRSSLPRKTTLEKIANCFDIPSYEMLFSVDLDTAYEYLVNSKAEIDKEQNAFHHITNIETQTLFRNFMYLGGYDDIILMIDYLELADYKIKFKPIKSTVKKDELEKERIHINNHLNKLQIEIKKKQLQIIELKERIAKYRTPTKDISKQHLEQLNALTNELMDLKAQYRKVSLSLDKTRFTTEPEMREVLDILNECMALPYASLEAKLKTLNLETEIYSFKDGNTHTISFYDFYKLCENFSYYISNQISSLPIK